MADESVTLGIILEHMRGFESRFTQELRAVTVRMDRMDRNLSAQIDAIDRRLDTVEIGQLRIEQHLGLAPVR